MIGRGNAAAVPFLPAVGVGFAIGRDIFLVFSSVTMIALLFGRGLVVDALQRVRPGLACRLAGARRIELLTEAEGIGEEA